MPYTTFEKLGRVPTMQIKYDNLGQAVEKVLSVGRRREGERPVAPDSWHRDQDLAKREVIKPPLYLSGEFGALGFERGDLYRYVRHHSFDSGSA